jgi:hydroxymethylglutaryl-CoA lyase
MNDKIQLVECPRDAMQGWKKQIPTGQKIAYINALLKVGFDTIDFGSFVSAKAIPQMADTKQVIEELDLSGSQSKLLAIIANVRGAKESLDYDKISLLGYPFSVSPTFQLRNTNSTIEASFESVKEIQELCVKNNKQLVIYISMGFGNPYGDSYDEEIVMKWVNKIAALGITIISIADTVGLASPPQVAKLVKTVINDNSKLSIGVHLHSTTLNWKEKIDAALLSGCRRFDGALKGIGGCPMANDELVGNMNTELMIPYFEKRNMLPALNKEALANALIIANKIFI